MWRLLLGFAPATIGFCFLLTAINRLREVAQIMRWLALPFVILIPLALLPVFSALQTASFGSASFCGTAAAWHAWWAPVQLLTLVVISFMVFRVWRLAGYEQDQ